MSAVMNLAEQGWRFIHRKGSTDGFTWVHPSDLRDDDVDCTDMDDATFVDYVKALEPKEEPHEHRC